MKIISFDVGYRNLAYCIVHISEEGNICVEELALKDFGKVRSVSTIVPTVISFLQSTFSTCEWDLVLIENQVGSKLRCFQFIIHTYFESIKPKHVQIVAATTKFHGQQNLCTNTYSNRKCASVDVVTRLCSHDNTMVKWLQSHEKQDDLCDCLLQVLGHLKKKKISHKDTDMTFLFLDVCGNPKNRHKDITTCDGISTQSSNDAIPIPHQDAPGAQGEDE